MACLLFFNFLLITSAVTLLLLGITTSRWLVLTDGDQTFIESERTISILYSCQRLYRQGNSEQFSLIKNLTNRNSDDEAFVCYNRLFKWANASAVGPELLDYQKVLIGISLASGVMAVLALVLSQLLKTDASFHNLSCSKRIIEFLLITTILTVILALINLALFLGFERLQSIIFYGYSFWTYVAGTCCAFLSCILIAVYRIDVEFEFRRYRHESVATLC